MAMDEIPDERLRIFISSAQSNEGIFACRDVRRRIKDYLKEFFTSGRLLMPRFILEKVMKKYKCENGIPVYGWNVFAPEDKIKLRKMADCMGVSHQALVIRLKTLKLLMPHDLTEYLEKGLQLGGAQ